MEDKKIKNMTNTATGVIAAYSVPVAGGQSSFMDPNIISGASQDHVAASPTRSPRMESLLMALGDVITGEEQGHDSEQTLVLSEEGDWNSTLTIRGVVAVGEQGHDSQRTLVDPEDGDSGVEEDDWDLPGATNEEDDTIRPYHSFSSSTTVRYRDSVPLSGEPNGDAPSSVELSTAGFDMLSPVGMQNAPPIPFAVDGCEVRREDSVDSGYADSWTGPSPFVLSPPRSPGPASTLDLLSSPFGTPSRIFGGRIPLSPRLGPLEGNDLETHKESTNEVPHTAALDKDLDLDSGNQSIDSFSLDHPAANSTFADGSPSWPVFDVAEEYFPLQDTDQPNPSFVPMSQVDNGFDSHRSSDQGTSSRSDSSPLIPSFAPVGEAASKFTQHLATCDKEASSSSPLAEQAPESGVSHSPFEDALESPITYHSSNNMPGDNSMEREDGNSSSFISSSVISAFPVPPAGGPVNTQYGQEELVTAVASSGVTAPAVFTPPMRVETHVMSLASTRLSSPFRPVSSLGFAQKDEGKVSHRGSVSEAGGEALEQQSSSASSSTKVPFGFRPSSGLAKRTSLNNRHRSTRPNTPISTDVRTTPAGDSLRLSPEQCQPIHSPSWLKPLRLSQILTPTSPDFSKPFSNQNQSPRSPLASPMSPSVSSEISDIRLLSSARSSLIPENVRNTLIPANNTSSPLTLSTDHLYIPSSPAQPKSAPISNASSWLKFSNPRPRSSMSHYEAHHPRVSSRLSEPTYGDPEDDDLQDDYDDDLEDNFEETIRKRSSMLPRTAPVSRPSSLMQYSLRSLSTPRPTLLFAIASDNVDEVRRVLQGDEASPNDQVGPQSALAFTLTNDKLKNKVGIVRELLAHGADPSVLRNPDMNPPHSNSDRSGSPLSPPSGTTHDGMDAATRYYIAKAEASHTRRTSDLIYRSVFRPLARVRYDIVGQDRALEQLFRVLSMHSQQLYIAPLVVLLCGPSGHGKSLLARKFGSLLDFPTHTVNMSTLRSTHDIWLSCSMCPYEELSTSTLTEFLMDNEGKRCVVVLDEIDKTEDERYLLSLLMPWEIGRCSPEAGRRHIDVRNVIWLGTSNIGHDLVFSYQDMRSDPTSVMLREEYVELMGLLRPIVSDRLGASLLSRVTTVLPFVPFTEDEKMAIAAEALFALNSEIVSSLSSDAVESLVRKALDGYLPTEGARSLHRNVSTQLMDMFDS